MKVELHVIQNFAPSCLNRDDVNAPKDCEFGGFRRARISSQCFKRAVRTYWDRQGLLPENRARRTRRLVGEVARALEREGINLEEATRLVEFVLEAAGLAVTSDGSTEYLLFLGEEAIGALKGAVREHWDELFALCKTRREGAADAGAAARKKKKSVALDLPPGVRGAVQALFDGRKAADLALFGRMVADKPEYNIDAACQVAHAISTHRVNMEVDFYTAVDDLQPQEEAGAGMMGAVEFNSACFYRYSLVDFRQLVQNLGGDGGLAVRALEGFIKAAVEAIPSGKQNSMAAHNLPSFVMAVVRARGMPWSLANAFEEPVRPRAAEGGGLVAQSIRRLDDYWGRLKRCYGQDGIVYSAALTLEDVPLQHVPARVESVQSLVDEVVRALGVEA